VSEAAKPSQARGAAWYRIASQAAFLAIFVFLFALASFPIPGELPVGTFLQLDPLITLSTSITARSAAQGLWLAAIVMCSALVAGRFFCGYVCPLGAMLDFADSALFARIRKKARDYPRLSQIRYGLLVFIFAAALAGSAELVWLSPMSLLTRFSTDLAFPLVGRALASLGLANYRPTIGLDPVALALLVVVFGSLLLQGRFWCRNLCPLGALLGLAGRFGYRPVVAQSCQDCGNCTAACPMGAMAGTPKQVNPSQCHQCLECQRVCSAGSITLSMPGCSTLRCESAPREPSRRSFLLLGSAGAAGLALNHLPIRPWLRLGKKNRLLRPPGVFDEEEFLDRCVRCGECLKVCAYNCLQPVRFEQGLLGIGSPHFVMRVAGCDPACAACGEVCPSSAIPELALAKKKTAVIGLAEINRTTCRLWKEQLCDRCLRACDDAGYRAIEPSFEEGFMRIRINPDTCNGCGWCEHACPVNQDVRMDPQQRAAIVVVRSERRHLAQGG
jgi:ferredoxin